MVKYIRLCTLAGLMLSGFVTQMMRHASAAQADADTPDQPAPAKRGVKVPKDHQFTDTMPKEAKDPEGNQWDPRKGAEVQSEQWIYIETAAKGTIPVKLYVVAFDMRKAGVSKATLEKTPNPVRVQRIGFETTGVPNGEPARTFTYDAPEITGKSGQPTFTLKRTPGAEPYTVFTETPVFP